MKPLPSSKVTQRHPRPISATPAERAATFPITDRLESSEQEEARLQDETRRNQLRILAHKMELESMHVERELFAARAESASRSQLEKPPAMWVNKSLRSLQGTFAAMLIAIARPIVREGQRDARAIPPFAD